MYAKRENVNMADIGRRGFLGMAATAPIAAQEFLKQTGTSVLGSEAANALASTHPVPSSLDGNSKLIALKRAGLLPDWFIRQRRAYSQATARVLDPDIAALRSVSVAAKLNMQAERNFQREMDTWEQRFIDSQLEGKFFGWIT